MLTDHQLGQLDNLKRDRGSGWEKPHKPALLLALVDLMERGLDTSTTTQPLPRAF